VNKPARIGASLQLDEYTHGIVYDVLEDALTTKRETGQIITDKIDVLCHDLAAIIVAALMM
jgi:hypothetical protein